MADVVPTPDPLLGRVVSGRYRIVARIGAGGMGIVYRAWDGPGARYVVVKVPAERARDPEVFLARFSREMAVLRGIDHPHVVPIIDDGTCDGRPFAVMPYLAGGSLAVRRPRRDGAIQPASAALLYRWLPDVATALDHIHALGFVHRDVKPDNILFDGHGRAFLSDFGLARVSDDLVSADPSLTDTGTVLGTPDYMDPHVLRGGAPVPAGDQYALAVVVYELLAGRRPIGGGSPAARMIAQVTEDPQRLWLVRPDLPRSVGEAVHRGLAKQHGKRFWSCHSFAAAVLAEITPPPALRQRRLTCPACQMLIASDDRHGGKFGACPQCKSTVWIAPDLLALVIPADREPTPGTAEQEIPSASGVQGVPAEALEAAPASVPLNRAGILAALRQSLRTRRAVAGGAACAATVVGLSLLFAPDRPAEPPAARPLDGASGVSPAMAPPSIPSETHLARATDDPAPGAGDPGAPEDAIPADHVDTAMADEPTPAPPSEQGVAVAAPLPADSAALAGSPPPAEGAPLETPAPENHPPADPRPAGPPRIGAIAVDPADAIVRKIEPLFEEWETSVQEITRCEKEFETATPPYMLFVKSLKKVSDDIAAYERKAFELGVLIQQARSANDAVRYEALLVEQTNCRRQAEELRPEQEKLRRDVEERQRHFASLNAEIANHYTKIAMALPRWVGNVAPFDRSERSAATRELIDDARTATEMRFAGKWTHLESLVIELHLATATTELPTAAKAVVDLVDRIEAADRFLAQRQVPPEQRRRLLHFHRLHVGYATFRVLAEAKNTATGGVSTKKLDEWLRKQDELIQSRPAGFMLRGLHELADGNFATAAKRFDEFLDERPKGIRVESVDAVMPNNAVLHTGKYIPAVDEPLNAAFRGEIAWFFAAAPSPLADPAKARKLVDDLAGANPPWQALRAEAELCAREERWEDALAALARAEQRAPLLLAAEIREQRTAYENRRPFTLSRTR